MYKSAKTPHGNVGMSVVSQDAADAQARQMDATGCTNCTNCTNCWYCTDCTDCTDCRDCTDCTDCRDCTNCTECTDCAGALRWEGGPATQLLVMNGLRWPIATDGQRIQIGCQLHTVEEWQGFTDAEICNMASGALEFWRLHKPIIMQLAQTRKGEN